MGVSEEQERLFKGFNNGRAWWQLQFTRAAT